MQTKSIPYTFSRAGYYYFTRRVPKDLAHHYSRLRIVECLRTTSAKQAKMQAQQANAKLEAYWASLRVARASLPGASINISYKYLILLEAGTGIEPVYTDLQLEDSNII